MAALTTDVKSYLDRWVRWGIGVPMYQRSILGKIMDGLGSTMCPACRGQGRAPGFRCGSAATWVDPCPQCNGLGRVRAELTARIQTRTRACPICKTTDSGGNVYSSGEIAGRTCACCRGVGKLLHISVQVNPAGIRGTRYHGINEDDDPVSEAIDRLVSSWLQHDPTVWWNKVILEEHLCGGLCTQEVRARRLSISRRFYLRKLSEAYQEIGALIDSI